MLAFERVCWILRVGVAAEFIGHGAFGLLRKPEWVQLLQALGFDEAQAAALLPIIGGVDVVLGVVTLLRPHPALLASMGFWGLLTALARPLAGMSPWEAVEGAYNFGVPWALLFLLLAGRGGKGLVDARRWRAFDRFLRACFAVALVGHGFLHLRIPLVAGGDFLLAAAVGAFPIRRVCAAALFWKGLTELWAPESWVTNIVWELVERGSAYAIPLALLALPHPRWRPVPGGSGDAGG